MRKNAPFRTPLKVTAHVFVEITLLGCKEAKRSLCDIKLISKGTVRLYVQYLCRQLPLRNSKFSWWVMYLNLKSWIVRINFKETVERYGKDECWICLMKAVFIFMKSGQILSSLVIFTIIIVISISCLSVAEEIAALMEIGNVFVNYNHITLECCQQLLMI